MREIAMMVRRETISFEPQDRVKLDLNVRRKDGTPVDYFIGDVYYNFDLSKISFRLYDDAGKLVIGLPENRVLDDSMSSADLAKVSQKVQTYFENSVYRARNVAMIRNMVAQSPEGVLRFHYGSGGGPDVCVANLGEDTLEHLPVEGVCRSEDGALLAIIGNPQNGRERNYPFTKLTDMGVSNIASYMSRLSATMKKDREQGPAKQAASTMKM